MDKRALFLPSLSRDIYWKIPFKNSGKSFWHIISQQILVREVWYSNECSNFARLIDELPEKLEKKVI